MTKPIISVENLSKAYRLGHKEEVPDTLVGAVSGILKAPFRNWKRLSSLDMRDGGESDDILWALKDVSFDVHEGEVVGIIGRNGAGKSTLLKVLSRITEPTSGCVKLRGRVSSLLEVGTGFHPELTGRDNIYMNGTILGMMKREIDRKFDEIVEFSGVEKFLDTPVKRYSSGMQVRLAFAVAAHLEPEILIVDEVLAVGDAEFQKKCLGKMQDVASGGRTVLFVSHNMGTIRSLCHRGILLASGSIAVNASVGDAVDTYMSQIEGNATCHAAERTDRGGNGHARIRRVTASVPPSGIPGVLIVGGPARFTFEMDKLVVGTTCIFTIYDSKGAAITNIRSHPLKGHTSANARASVTCELDELLLVPGRYRINVALQNGSECLDHLEGATFFDVEAGNLRGMRVAESDAFGSVRFPHQWN